MSMRKYFADLVSQEMAVNPNIYVLTGDLGYKVWDTTRALFPNRFINVGAAEQSMVGIGVGLALEGKIPFVYSITPFLLYRPFETIRNYINAERIPVKLIGAGRNTDYTENGPSHWATEDRTMIKLLSNITGYWPENTSEVDEILHTVISSPKPYYINLKR